MQRSLAYLTLLASLAGSVIQPQATKFPWQVRASRRVGADANIGLISGTAIARDGSIFVLDYAICEVLKFDSRGRLLWRKGSQGRASGQFIVRSAVRRVATVGPMSLTRQPVK